MRNRVLTMFLLAMLPFVCLARERKLTGRVVDTATKKPIPEVWIRIEGTDIRTATNQVGYFELSIDDAKHKIMNASRVGYATKLFDVPTVDKFQFTLDARVLQLPGVFFDSPDLVSDAGTPAGEIERNASFDGLASHIRTELMSRSIPRVKRVFVRFTVDESGRVSGISQSDTTDAVQVKAIDELFQQMSGWRPATQGGKPVSQSLQVQIAQRAPQLDVIGKFYRYLGEKIQYPANARSRGKQGAVDVEFTVTEDGKAIDVVVTRDVDGVFAAELKRVLTKAPSEPLLALVKSTESNRFILPLSFGLEVPFIREPVHPTDRYILTEMVVTAKSAR